MPIRTRLTLATQSCHATSLFSFHFAQIRWHVAVWFVLAVVVVNGTLKIHDHPESANHCAIDLSRINIYFRSHLALENVRDSTVSYCATIIISIWSKTTTTVLSYKKMAYYHVFIANAKEHSRWFTTCPYPKLTELSERGNYHMWALYAKIASSFITPFPYISFFDLFLNLFSSWAWFHVYCGIGCGETLSAVLYFSPVHFSTGFLLLLCFSLLTTTMYFHPSRWLWTSYN